MTETAEQRAARRRWINLAELVAVGGVLIGALTLWVNWSDRREDKAQAAATSAAEARDRDRFDLNGKADGREILLLRDDTHALGDVRIVFPTALGVGPQDAVGHMIEAEWFERPLLKLTDKGPDERTGRLPVLVTYAYTSGDQELTRTAVYDVIWKTGGRFLRGRTLELTDFRLRRRGGSQATLDTLWAREKP